jgi:hypothetical protein
MGIDKFRVRTRFNAACPASTRLPALPGVGMLFMSARDRLVALAAHHGLPAI